jgi:hypothetical protein
MREIVFEGKHYLIDEELSQQDFTGKSLRDKEIKPGTVIYQSCFCQEVPHANIFKRGLTGVTFINCNLDNVYIPSGNLIKGGSNNIFECQRDGHDWVIDHTHKPVRLLNEKYHKIRKEREALDAGLQVQLKSTILEKPKPKNFFIRYFRRMWRALWR